MTIGNLAKDLVMDRTTPGRNILPLQRWLDRRNPGNCGPHRPGASPDESGGGSASDRNQAVG